MASGLTLDALAADINGRLKKGAEYLEGAKIHLEEARQRIANGEAGGAMTWRVWCEAKLVWTHAEIKLLVDQTLPHLGIKSANGADNADTRKRHDKPTGRPRGKPKGSTSVAAEAKRQVAKVIGKSTRTVQRATQQTFRPASDHAKGLEVIEARGWLNRALMAAQYARYAPVETCPRSKEVRAAVKDAAEAWAAVLATL